MSSPLSEIGVEEPMFVCGAIAAMSAAMAITAPASRARAGGATYTTTGTSAREEPLDDSTHRRGETARRVEDEHHRRVLALLSPVDRVLDELLRHGLMSFAR